MSLERFDASRAQVATPHADLSYVSVGEGPPAVFVHGVGTSAYLWRNLIDRVAGARRCLAFDLPLHGASPARPDQDFTLAGLAELIEEFCDALGLVEIDLVAHDTGGALAQIFAARHPERLLTLTLTNCDTHDNVPPPAFQPTVDLARAGQLAPQAPDLLADMAVARAAVFASGYERPDDLDLDVVRAFLEPVLGTPERAQAFERLLVGL